MPTTSVVSSGLASIAPELKPFYIGTGTAGTGTVGQPGYVAPSADYTPGLLGKGQQVYAQNYDQQIGNALDASGLGGPKGSRVAGLFELESQVGQQVGAMQTPGQFGTGSQLSTTAGQGQLGTVGQAAQYGSAGYGAGQAGQAMGQQAAGLAAPSLSYGASGSSYGAQGAGIGQQATGLTGAGLSYGNMGAGIGAQAAQAGQNYNAMATNPYAQQAFMSPYLQNALAPQLEEMRRQYGITGTQQMGNATKSGAFGGSREALMASENARNMGTAMNQAIGSGYQNAFQQAQQAQQFGANLGLQGQQTGIQGAQAGLAGINAANQLYQTGLQGTAQGMQGAQVGLQGVNAANQAYQTGLQGNTQALQGAQIGLQGVAGQQAGYAGANQAAATLGQLGTQQQAADMARLQAMSAQGATERGISQQNIDNQYQDLMTRLNYPKEQLTGMQGLLTGTPTASTSSTQATTTPPPSFASQLAGAGLTGLSLYNMFK